MAKKIRTPVNKVSLSEKEFTELQRIVIAFSTGDFSGRITTGEGSDEKSTVMAAINMLGEELEATTVTRDYLKSIFDAFQDVTLILDENGKIQDLNQSVEAQLGFDRMEIIGKNIELFFENEPLLLEWKTIRKELKKRPRYVREHSIRRADRGHIPVLVSCSLIRDRYDRPKGYLMVARDITDQKQTERLIVQTIVKTQEKEQKRVAEDLHDSLGQELSGLKLFLNALSANAAEWDQESRELVESTKNILDGAIENLRSISFDLMPKSLAYDGIGAAIEELFQRLNQQKTIRFTCQYTDDVKGLNKAVELLLFRITQEFINNSMKHSGASKITLKLSMDNMRLKYSIRDNGKGFDLEKVKSSSLGRGLTNMESRVKAFDGHMLMKSEKGIGTSLFVSFLINSIK